MMCLTAQLNFVGDHIITLAKQDHNVWQRQTHNSKLNIRRLSTVSRRIFAKNQEKTCFLQRKTGLRPGNTARFRFYVYQNDIRADPSDAAPGNHVVVPAAPQSKMAAGTGDEDGNNIALRQLDPGIGHKA